MTGTLFYAFLMSLLIGTILTPCLMLGARRAGLLDQPGHRKVHKEPIARVGGIAFAVGALVSISYWAPKSDVVVGVVAGLLIIMIMGSLDDFLDLRVRYKFGGQVLAASIMVVYGDFSWQPFSMFLGLEIPSWLAVPLTITMLVAITNAMNLSDGLDGLAGGLSFLSFGLIVCLAYQINDVLVMFLTLPIMGGLLGFLRFNTFPARVFMGDGGSQFLGFALGAAALLLTDVVRSPFNPLLVIFFIGVPLLDLVTVMTQRFLTGGNPFQADQEHFHHKLLTLGFSHHQVVLIIYVFQIVLVALAYACRWSSDFLLGVFYLLLLAMVGSFYYGVYSGRLSCGLFKKWSSETLYWRTWLHAKPWLAQGSLYGLVLGVVGFFLLGLILPSALPEKGSNLIVWLGVIVIWGLYGDRKTSLLTTRMGLYLGSTFVLYGVEHALVGATLLPHLLFQGFFGLVFIGLILTIHLDSGKQFTPNPMDYLLLFLALVMPVLFNVQWGVVEVGEMMAKLIILFFACEVLLQAFSAKVRHLGYLSGGVLLSLATRSLW